MPAVVSHHAGVVRAVGGRSQCASLVTAAMALATMLVLAPVLGRMPNALLGKFK
jgi:MFS superfamily sulfate permease-like transporter